MFHHKSDHCFTLHRKMSLSKSPTTQQTPTIGALSQQPKILFDKRRNPFEIKPHSRKSIVGRKINRFGVGNVTCLGFGLGLPVETISDSFSFLLLRGGQRLSATRDDWLTAVEGSVDEELYRSIKELVGRWKKKQEDYTSWWWCTCETCESDLLNWILLLSSSEPC